MKAWSELPTGKVLHFFQQFLVALGEKAELVITTGNADEAFIKGLAEEAVTKVTPPPIVFEPSPSQKRAQEIMGSNFFGIEEAIKHFGVNATKQQLAALAEVPFSEEVLKSCKDTHVLIAVFPLSIFDIRGITRKLENQTLFYKQDWYDKQAFAKDKGEISWQLVRKEPVTDSPNKTWKEQQDLLSKDEETPTAQIMVYTIIGHFLNTGERLFEKVYARTSSVDSGGYRVRVGDFNSRGLEVNDWNDGHRNGNLGIASARK